MRSMPMGNSTPGGFHSCIFFISRSHEGYGRNGCIHASCSSFLGWRRRVCVQHAARKPQHGHAQFPPLLGLTVDLQHAQSIPEMAGPSLFHFSTKLMNRRSGTLSHQGSLGGMPMDSFQDEMNEAHLLSLFMFLFTCRYKWSSGLFISPQKQIQPANYVLPSSFIFPRPSVTPENIKSFSVEAAGGV